MASAEFIPEDNSFAEISGTQSGPSEVARPKGIKSGVDGRKSKKMVSKSPRESSAKEPSVGELKEPFEEQDIGESISPEFQQGEETLIAKKPQKPKLKKKEIHAKSAGGLEGLEKPTAEQLEESILAGEILSSKPGETSETLMKSKIKTGKRKQVFAESANLEAIPQSIIDKLIPSPTEAGREVTEPEENAANFAWYVSLALSAKAEMGEGVQPREHFISSTPLEPNQLHPVPEPELALAEDALTQSKRAQAIANVVNTLLEARDTIAQSLAQVLTEPNASTSFSTAGLSIQQVQQMPAVDGSRPTKVLQLGLIPRESTSPEEARTANAIMPLYPITGTTLNSLLFSKMI